MGNIDVLIAILKGYMTNKPIENIWIGRDPDTK
jgi:hypothetical protein